MAVFIPTRFSPPRQDLTGLRYGKLVVKEWVGRSHWICLCDCGRETRVLTANLSRGNTTSCGCLRNMLSSKRNTKHGLHQSPAYKTWHSVKRRCFDKKNVSYKHYGARGITMHEPWINDPAAFIAHVGQPPSDNHTLDRINNSLGYVPGNLRWATPMEQGSNKSNNRMVTFQGKTMTIAQLARYVAEECGISPRQFRRAFEKQVYGRG